MQKASLIDVLKYLRICSVIIIFAISFLGSANDGMLPVNKDFKAEKSSQNYGGMICHEANTTQKIIDAADDLARLLKEASGQSFEVKKSIPNSPAIVLLEKSSPLVSAEISEKLNSSQSFEAFLIKNIESSGQLWIVAKNELGLQAGIYTYLKMLGFKFYYPGDRWKIVPNLKDVTLNVDKLCAPKFAERRFFGTGGFGGALPLDQDMRQKSLWDKYMARNRLGGRTMSRGHIGEAFNVAHKDFLTKEHPEYLAWVDGRRNQWSESAKHDCSNPGFVDFFVKDRLENYNKRGGPENLSTGFAIGVEPADGGGYCECDKCQSIAADYYGMTGVRRSGISDQVFHLANRTAKAVNEAYPGMGKVSLLAYAQHCEPPNFPIEPNIYVTAVPYGFNHTGIDGDDLLRIWIKRASPGNVGIYDYWAITDWSNCLPELDYCRQMRQLHLYDRLGISGCCFESSYSAGAIGLAWWLASRILWDPSEDEGKLLEDFYSDCFSGSKVPMRRMIDRWAKTGFMLSAHEIGLSTDDLKEAMKLSSSPAETARLRDYAVYIHYMRLFLEYDISAKGSKERLKAIDGLSSHMWRIYDTAMVHPFRMWQLLVRNNKSSYAGKGLEEDFNSLVSKWTPKKGDDGKYSPAWNSISPYTDSEVDKILNEDDKAYDPLSFSSISYNTDDLVPLSSSPSCSETDMITTPVLYRKHDFVFVVPSGVSRISIPFKGTGKISIKDNSGIETFSKERNSDSDWDNLEMPVRPGRYFMRVNTDGIFRMKLPRRMPFVAVGNYVPYLSYSKDSFAPAMTHAYFYIPKGVSVIGAYIPTSNSENLPGQIWNEKQVRVSPENPPPLFEVKVPQGHQGLIWSCRGYSEKIRLLSTPNVFSFSPEGMMVPAELLKKGN